MPIQPTSLIITDRVAIGVGDGVRVKVAVAVGTGVLVAPNELSVPGEPLIKLFERSLANGVPKKLSQAASLSAT